MNPSEHPIYHWFLWNVLSRIFVRFYLSPLYNFRKSPDSDPIPKPPFLVIANHGTFFDPWIVGCFSYSPFNFMCNDDAFRASPTTRWYLESIGAFPKKKGAVDVRALKETLRRLNRGSAVCIFPEGQTTWDGSTQLIHKGIERVAKQARCPIVMARIRGNFLTKPWWAKTKRSGSIAVRYKVIPADEVQAFSDEAIFERMRSYIQHSDVKDPENRTIAFRGRRLAEGLERFVWICMHCGVEDRLVMSGDAISCRACNGGWTIDAHCRLAPTRPETACLADLKDWADAHRTAVLRRIGATGRGRLITSSQSVTLQTLEPDGYTFASRCTGALSLTPDSLAFVAPDFPQYALDLPVAEMKDYVIQKKDIFEVRHHDTHYRFLFSRHSPMKWVYYIRYLNGYDKLEERGWLG